jgi:hypothetical protein
MSIFASLGSINLVFLHLITIFSNEVPKPTNKVIASKDGYEQITMQTDTKEK